MAASDDRNVVILNVGDKVTVQIDPSDEGKAIITAISITTDGTTPDPVTEDENTTQEEASADSADTTPQNHT